MSTTANPAPAAPRALSLREAVRRGVELVAASYLGVPHLKYSMNNRMQREFAAGTDALDEKFQSQVAHWDGVIEEQARSLVQQSKDLLWQIQVVDRLVPHFKLDCKTHFKLDCKTSHRQET